ncbi:unnamed protein product [Caenorhabditis sp. 36 PRJEB53466]|nr:unnamed protein product [Caenorhabditis sp. 36 PRJEB53466]
MKGLLAVGLLIFCVHSAFGAAIVTRHHPSSSHTKIHSNGTHGKPSTKPTIPDLTDYYTANDSVIVVKRRVPTQQEINDILVLLNTGRQALAYLLKIPGMQELSWDEGLVAKVKAMPATCEQWKYGADYRIVPLQPDEGAQMVMNAMQEAVSRGLGALKARIQEMPEEKRKELGKQLEGEIPKIQRVLEEMIKTAPTLFELELINPDQNKIGCAAASCHSVFHSNEPSLSSVEGKMYGFSVACLLGPQGSLDTKAIGKGDAGTACKNGKSKIDGLCKSSSSLLTTGSVIGFLLIAVSVVFF